MTETTGEKSGGEPPSALAESAKKAREAAARAAAGARPLLARAAAKAREASARFASGAAGLAREVSVDIRTGVAALRADLQSGAEKKRLARASQEREALRAREAEAARAAAAKKSVLYPDAALHSRESDAPPPSPVLHGRGAGGEGKQQSPPNVAEQTPSPLTPLPLAGEGDSALHYERKPTGAAPPAAPAPIAKPLPDPPLSDPPLAAPAPERRYRPIGDATLGAEKPLAEGSTKADPPMTAQPGVLRATSPSGLHPEEPSSFALRGASPGRRSPQGEERRSPQGEERGRLEGRRDDRKGKPKGNAFADLFLLATSLAFAGGAAGLFLGFVVLAPRIEEGADLWAVNRLPSVIVLDRNGEELAARGARYGQAVAVADLPPYLVSAILATEDRRFYEHHGVDIRGMARALLANFRSGEVVEGGSTITQQLARNLFLTPEQTYVRKAKEALLSFWIEGRYTKDQILSLYLNRIYLGAGAYGVEQAARTYFGKSARDVTLAEAVMLAGLPKAPSQLAPTLNPAGAQARANAVLDNLRETGAVTEFEAQEARSNPPRISDGGAEAELGYFFDYIAAEARTRAKGREGDLTVTTTLDKNLQLQAVAAVKSVIGVDSKLSGAEQAALIAYSVDGSLLAMVGGRSYVESQFNRATQAKRQPGSAFKPFVYAAALEAGLKPSSVFVDQPVEIDGWKPSNYTEGFQGRMRLTEAVAKSVNTVAVQVSESIGRDHVVELAKRFGVKSDLPAVPSIALGGVSVTLEELTGAYLPLANGGFAAEPHAIERIEDQNLEVIYQRRERKPQRIIDEQVSEGMNHLLFQVMNSGTGAGAALGSRVSAGKTGTTNDWRDAWFVGYTAQIVAGVWVGNDDFRPMERVTGGAIPAKIWRNFMIAAHKDLPNLPIKGAYPASGYGDENELVNFYTEILRGFNRVRRDGERRWRDR